MIKYQLSPGGCIWCVYGRVLGRVFYSNTSDPTDLSGGYLQPNQLTEHVYSSFFH